MYELILIPKCYQVAAYVDINAFVTNISHTLFTNNLRHATSTKNRLDRGIAYCHSLSYYYLLLKQIEGVGSIMIICFYLLLLLDRCWMVLSLLLLACPSEWRERWCVPTQEATEGIQYQKYAQNLEKYTQNLGYELKVCTVCTKSGMHKSGFWKRCIEEKKNVQ